MCLPLKYTTPGIWKVVYENLPDDFEVRQNILPILMPASSKEYLF